MQRSVAVLALVLSGIAASPVAGASVAAELIGEVDGISAPVIVPFDFGNQPLGVISNLTFAVCFRQTSSPSNACDAGGQVSLQQQLAPPFYTAGRFRENIGTGARTPVNFPVTLASGQRLVLYNQWVSNQVGPASDLLVLRGTTGGNSDTITLDLTGNGTQPGSCPPGNTQVMCLGAGNRFAVRSHFLTNGAQSGPAGTIETTPDTGALYFFSPDNWEAVLKVLNACPVNNRYWVFAGGLTDVRTVITVTDTQRNAVKTYINPQGTKFAPVQDTSAFATCP